MSKSAESSRGKIVTAPLTDEELAELAIFPLPNTVLFPHTILPLHIFEPRYRRMTEDALHGDCPIAVVLTHPDQAAEDRERPRVHQIAGVARIIDCHSLSDGRYNILLHCVGRVRFRRELDVTTPYRQVEAEWLPDEWPEELEPDPTLSTIRNAIVSLSRLQPEVGAPLFKMAYTVEHPTALVDVLSSVLFPDLGVRQELLEESSLVRRYETIISRLAELLVETSAEGGGSVLVN